MRREELYLRDIVEAADHIAGFVAGLDYPSFEASELIRSAVVQKITVIGEAAAHIPDQLRACHPGIPWPRIVAFRNILIPDLLTWVGEPLERTGVCRLRVRTNTCPLLLAGGRFPAAIQ